MKGVAAILNIFFVKQDGQDQTNKQTKSKPKSICGVVFCPLCLSAIVAHRLRKRYNHCANFFHYTIEGVATISDIFFVKQDGQDQTNKQTKSKPKSICWVVFCSLCQSAIVAHRLRKRYKHCAISFRYTMEGVAVILVRFLATWDLAMNFVTMTWLYLRLRQTLNG